MPYRRLPKTDAARLRALSTLLNNSDIYMARNRFIDWKTINRARPAYDRLYTACEQYKLCITTQARHSARIGKLQRNALMYISHFLQVLFMSVERGEIKKASLRLYGLDETATALPYMKTAESLLEWGRRIIAGEKARIKNGGRAIYNPTIGMVSTHYDIFRDIYEQLKNIQSRTSRANSAIQAMRAEVDDILLDLWNQIERHYESEPPEVRYQECRKLGVVYYNRKGDK